MTQDIRRHFEERETHRARALADALADVNNRLDELDSVQRAMAAQGIEPRHVMRLDSREALEMLFHFHGASLQWRLRHPGPSSHHPMVRMTKAKMRRVFNDLR